MQPWAVTLPLSLSKVSAGISLWEQEAVWIFPELLLTGKKRTYREPVRKRIAGDDRRIGHSER